MSPKFPINHLFLLLLAILATTGAVLVSDEFDDIRSLAFGFFAIPGTFLLIYSYFLQPRFWHEHPIIYRWIFGGLICVFSWGIFLLVNASVSRDVVMGKVFTTEVQDRSLLHAYKRGGFGHLYRLRSWEF